MNRDRAEPTLRTDLERLESHYDELIESHGTGAAGAQWRDRETQEKRMQVLAEIGDVREASVLDFGCGTGHLLTILRSRFGFVGSYVGIDLSEKAVDLARKEHSDARFERRDILTEGIDGTFDYVFVSGVFNNRLSDNWALLTTALQKLFAATRRGLAFNLLSIYVDRFEEGLWYADPVAVFQFCKERLSPLVSLRHDYEVRAGVVPFEFTVYVHPTDIACRPALRL
jgi:SAM-dependent methyltransferase